MQREIYTTMQVLEGSHWWFSARRDILKKVLNVFSPPAAGRRVLEVGCGSGGNLDLLSHYGQLHAMELDDTAREVAQRRGLCTVKKGMLPNDIPFDTQFDLICLFDVLEHVENDIGTLKALSRFLAANGVIVLTVPAYVMLWSHHDALHFHQRRYRRSWLARLASVSGLKVRYSSYFNSLLFAPIAAVRLLSGRNSKSDSDLSMPPKWLNGLLKTVFASERYLLPAISFPFGVSIVMVLQKDSVPA